MAFADLCDGYVVIHAHLVSPHRRPLFEAALREVGVTPIVLNGVPVADDHPALPRYGGNKGHVSLIETNLAALDMAEARGWRSIAIFEDDIVFRRSFHRLWAQVEPAVHAAEWDMLTLHRGPRYAPLVKELRGATRLLPLINNIWSQCVILRQSGYARFRESMQVCLAKGYPSDFVYGVFSRLGGKILATSRNLTGQRGGLRSSITVGKGKGDNFYEAFRSCRTWPEYFVVTTAFRLRLTLRNRKAHRATTGA